MTVLSLLAGPSSSRALSSCAKPSFLIKPLTPIRCVSSSPYGRTHVWKHRDKKLPKPFVPQFPQIVVRADGSTYTHYTTSPRSVIRLTRDTTNNPVWNPSQWLGENDEEDQVTGRLGRFNRKFDGIGGHGDDVDWMSGLESGAGAEELLKQAQALQKKADSKEKKEKPKAGRVR
ncbi:unnamed protein product [Somion occarium]|uniref:Uncharacterized protein n=1 Tax=Somion occarium TaxID=3059160 RepID=A0ABP1CRW3_9APHY